MQGVERRARKVRRQIYEQDHIGGRISRRRNGNTDVYHIERGYVDIENKLKKLGAKISRK